MDIKYRVLSYQPEIEMIAVELTSADFPDQPYIERFSFPDFSREKLIDQIQAIASRYAGALTRIPDHPSELTIPESGTVEVEPELYLPYEPNPQYEERPEIDPWTQDLIPGEVTSPTQETVPWVVYELTAEEQALRIADAANNIRAERDYRLAFSDGIMSAPDCPVEDKEPWLEYRQALRDVPQQPDFPKQVIWPTRPMEKAQ